jgi:type II secretory pathway pseudopilin PulG
MHIQQAVRQQQQQHQQQQQQQHQQQQQQQHQQQQQQNVRQMSPPSTQATSQMPGQGQPHNAGQPTVPNTNFNASAAVAAFGPNAIQNIQILQNPSHPFMQYMMQNVPGFTTLPVPQQLQRMQIVQVSL